MKYATKKQVIKWFKDDVYPHIPKHDKPMMSEAWNNYTDMLCKDGTISNKQYNNWTNPF